LHGAGGSGRLFALRDQPVVHVRNSDVNHTIRDDPGGWRHEGRDLLRAIAGGSLVGLPLLYTMEMWERGMAASAWHLLVLLAATLVVNFVFCLLSGFRLERGIGEAAIEAITGVGIAIMYSVGILWLLGELEPPLHIVEMIGKVLLETAAVSIGISFATAQMEGKSRTGEPQDEGAGKGEMERRQSQLSPGDRQLRADLRDFAAALAGATLFALNIAPTEEITLIASRLSPMRILAVLGVSILLCYIILFAAEFRDHPVYEPGAFQNPFAETLLTCAVSLVVAAGLLALMGSPSILTQPSTAVASVVVLGLPAIVGGAAGRLIA
jgi:putative integral membrane protein (TIGR02587 family)